ncbi:MAG: hypothetical protein N3B16_02985, partial [Candidatus Aminicenantes bacterium]|nr:hypothetical protein [Candidatus Aminicenantes bacterium]
YIKNNFKFGLYAWPSFSVTALHPNLPWHHDWNDASSGLDSLKKQIDSLIEAARLKGFRLHLVFCSGLARGLYVYREAKEEDIRNCMWYNDNKLCSDTQINEPNFLDNYVFGTLSRYARKLRANLEAKARALGAFLKQRMEEYPEVLVALSGWGEAEMNFNRLNHAKNIQDYICDYSPFAVLEFRDWILHTGLYDNENGKYKGEGYPGGGKKYQGLTGLAKFNEDFGTNFTTWDLRYFHWSLDDDFDSNPVDDINNDPHRLPLSRYSHGNMLPTSGPDYIPGGFDPPRNVVSPSKFRNLWELFRQTMVHNFVKDMARWMNEAGIPPEKWFSHQIPADYLWGSNPSWPELYGRYYSSASPLWTADIRPYGSIGATIYDIKFPPELFPGEFARTTLYVVPAISQMTDNWAAMEYDAETYPVGYNVQPSSPEVILEQYLRLYQHGARVINFWRWWDTSGEHRIKGTNKEIALRNFVAKIRDKARKKDLNFVFTPPPVVEFSGSFIPETNTVALKVSGRIWSGHSWLWTDWGDFAYFEIFKGEEPNFPADSAHLWLRSRNFNWEDKGINSTKKFYYKVRAVNSRGEAGPLSEELVFPRFSLQIETTEGGTTEPKPGLYYFEPMETVSILAIPAENYDFVGWTGDASGIANPLEVIMNKNKTIKANFKRVEVYPPLDFQGVKLVNRSLTKAEYVIKLTWKANPKNKNIVKYWLFRNDGETAKLLAELEANIFEYLHRPVAAAKTYVYSIRAVNNNGIIGEPATTVVN